jgi:AraC-like DNA-binding protein
MSVPQSDISQYSFLWTRGVAARETLYFLDRKGFDAEPLLSEAELSRSRLTDDPGGVSVGSQHRFLELAASETNDPLLGLHVAAEMDLRDIGLLYYLIASAGTVTEALEYLQRYAATMNEEVRLDISQEKEETLLTFRRVRALNVPVRQHSELIALAFNRVLCTLTNRDFAPSRMTFSHGRNSELREVHRILRCAVEFGQVADSWVLPQRIMDLPIISGDGHLLQILEAHADDLLSERSSASGLRGLVENHLLSVLSSGKVDAAAVAKHLGMSARSLSRHLAQEGTSFGDVLDELRHRLAVRYLEDKQIALQQIAWLLGYSEAGAFNHAFKRWTGTSPSLARTLLAANEAKKGSPRGQG